MQSKLCIVLCEEMLKTAESRSVSPQRVELSQRLVNRGVDRVYSAWYPRAEGLRVMSPVG